MIGNINNHKFAINRQVGQGEMKIYQEELMDPLVVGAFFMHPDQGFSIGREYVQVNGRHDLMCMMSIIG